MGNLDVKIVGKWDDTINFLRRNAMLMPLAFGGTMIAGAISSHEAYSDLLDRTGEMGVEALRQATPVDTGLAANSWNYRIVKSNKVSKIEWYNTDVEGGCNVAILIQYGHGTKSGTYVEGIDYINPALKPIFDTMADYLWKEVTK